MTAMSRCDDLIGNLSDYIDGELEPELCKELESHLAGCQNCRLMVDTMEMTVKLCRDGAKAEREAGRALEKTVWTFIIDDVSRTARPLDARQISIFN